MRVRETPDLLCAKDAARFLGITRRTLWRWVHEGRLARPVHLLSWRIARWKRRDLEAYLASHAQLECR